MALLKRIRVLAAKAETAAGTAEALTAAEAAFHVHDLMIQQGAEMEERMKQASFGRLPSVVSARQGKATFSTHFYGGSASPAGMATFLPGVGLGLTTGEYVLDALPPSAVGSTQKTLTLGSYQNGRIKKLHGCMGTMKCELPSGKLAKADFEFTGIWNAPIDGTILAPTFPTLVPLRVYSAALTIGSYSTFKVSNVSLSVENQIVLREDASSATGYAYAVIADRIVKITIDPEAELVATKDVYGEWLSGAEADLSIVLTNGTNTCTITASDVQFVNPQEADRNGIETDSIECQSNADDLKFVFA